jgi:hypothetical protein
MSTESATSLFADPSNNALLRRFAQDLKLLSEDLVAPAGLLRNLQQIIELMIANPLNFDEYGSVNSEWIGKQFFGDIEAYFAASTKDRQEIIRTIFTSAYRFLCELEFTQPGDPSFEVRAAINFVHNNLEAFNGNERQQLIYAAYKMPAQVAKKLIRHPAVTEFRKFSETVEKSRALREQWDKDLETRLNLQKGLSENIKRVTSEYNFVGLVNGFQKLKGTKESERRIAFWSLVIIGAMMLALPTVQINFVIERLTEIDKHRSVLIYSLPTIIAVEIIMLFFFRIVLTQFRSVKAQLLQVDLRISLCQFIESYAEYVSKLREKDSTALSKFEALIFSGLVAEESGIPSTFDGVEQVANLVRSLRG